MKIDLRSIDPGHDEVIPGDRPRRCLGP